MDIFNVFIQIFYFTLYGTTADGDSDNTAYMDNEHDVVIFNIEFLLTGHK